MNWTNIKRVFRAGFLDFWRNAFVSASSVLVMTVTLFSVGTVVFAGVILNTTLEELRNRADVSIYFLSETSEERIFEFKSALEARPEVQSVGYISREEALATFRERNRDDQVILRGLEELGNPLEASLQVQAHDISQYEAIAEFVRSQDAQDTGAAAAISKINFYDEDYRVALARLESITSSGQQLGLVIILILVATTIAISFNTLRLAIYSSREEIQVMRLVGAGQFYIRAPFMVEGMLYGVVAGVITLFLFYPLTWWMGGPTSNFFGGINVFTYYVSNFHYFFLLIIGTGALLGIVASYLAVRRYLKI